MIEDLISVIDRARSTDSKYVSQKVSKVQMQEREIQYLEEHIPELAESAVTALPAVMQYTK